LQLCEDPDLLSHPVPFDPEEAEALLESYLQEIHTIRTKTKLLQQRIQNTESLIMIKLDTARNHLLTVDLVFSLVTVSLTFGTFVTAAFGMNLVTGLEEEVGAFTLVMLATLLASVVMVVLGVLYFRRRGVM
jgi:magnesium transporter